MTILSNLKTLAAAAALLAGFSAPAAAAEEMVPLQTISHWEISADSKICTAIGEFRDGTYLSFAIGATSGVATIGIFHPKWAVPTGSYEVVSWVDRTQPVKFPAYAEGPMVTWKYPLDADHINLLSYGRTLYAQVGRQLYQYDLARSEAVLKALGTCASERLASFNPFAGQQPQAKAPPANPFAETASNPYRKM